MPALLTACFPSISISLLCSFFLLLAIQSYPFTVLLQSLLDPSAGCPLCTKLVFEHSTLLKHLTGVPKQGKKKKGRSWMRKEEGCMTSPSQCVCELVIKLVFENVGPRARFLHLTWLPLVYCPKYLP